jgi:4-amino-4-deoxy-L-arabinose transferase-like glycosyltransferase
LSSVKPSRAFWIAGIGLFIFSGILIFLLTADLFHPSLDEGIYLEGGHRLLQGEWPYRDFFAYTGPLIYWVQAGLEKIFGPDLRMLRLSTALSVGLTCFGIFWMAERFVGWTTGVAVALVFLGMRMPSFQHFTVNHRWLSTSLMTLSIAAALDAARNDRARWGWVAAGAFGAAAAWATPTYLIPLLIPMIWAAYRRQMRSLGLIAGGALLVSLPAVAALASHGALVPMFDRLVWASRQYSVANRVRYGYYPFGFENTRAAAGLVPKILAWVGDVRLMIPVLLIPAAIVLGFVQVASARAAGRGAKERRNPPVQPRSGGHDLRVFPGSRRWSGPAALLVWLALGMFLTTWPRWDVNLLIGVTPPCYVLLAIWCEERLQSADRIAVRAAVLAAYAVALSLSAYYALRLFSTVNSFSYFPTRVGLLRNVEADSDAYAALEERIPEGSSLFVFPYMPSIGYMLRTRNPTSYSYLQPGMMSRADEAVVLRELEARPPQFILRQYLPYNQILSVWPHSNRSAMTFPSIEAFIARRYVPVEDVKSEHFALRLFARRTP